MKSFHEVLNPAVCQCNEEIRSQIIGDLPFLKMAGSETKRILESALRSQGLTEGMEISPLKFQNGLFGVVARGAFKVYRFVKDNQFVIFDVLTAGDYFLYGFTDSRGLRMFLYPDVLQAMTTSCLLFMDQTKLEPILQRDQPLLSGFFEGLMQRLAQMNERFIRFMAFPADHRLAYLLRFLHGKGPRNTEYPGLIPFNLTRKDLASMAGLTLETASRVLSGFERQGWIRSGRAWVEILDSAGLENLSHTEVL